jgi:GT2 family glycosyltransferase
MERIRVDGMFFSEASRRFWLRGVSYGPFRPNGAGEFLPEPAVVETDLALVCALGANCLRVYHPPPDWFVERSQAAGLRLLVGLPWAQHIRFLDDPRTREEIRTSVRQAARRVGSSPSTLALLIGNEISPQIMRWYGPARVRRFLAELADEVREQSPDALVSYVSYPSTEYLELDFLDFLSFNVYLHDDAALRGYLARLQNLAGFKPLVLSEFGADSLREGESEQARILAGTAIATAQLGLAGAVAFAFTDEWHTGGHDIESWRFGLVGHDRHPKPAYTALRDVFHSVSPPLPDPCPRVSVVVCAHNEQRTLRACLESLSALRYPNCEVIVVDDGSTDGTRAIAEAFPGFKLISHENRGLSEARNSGVRVAEGEIVAFTDGDCEVDPDWLTFLVRRLLSQDFVGVGGPNLPPREESWIPEVVARCPGGPSHVLLTDREAEHVPGCNMAFRRDALLEIGLFDRDFRAAGDDVDICWRMQNAGHRIGFAASALVWHRRRSTVPAYLSQQRGYGHAEGLLSFKHPWRFNFAGNSRWLGRIYAGGGAEGFRQRPVIYAGPFGSGLFQTLYEAPGSVWRHLPGTLEWNALVVLLLGAAAAARALGGGLPELAWLAVGLSLVTAAWAIGQALRVDVREVPAPAWKARALISLLTWVGPLVRAVERYRTRVAGLGRAEGIPSSERSPKAPIGWRARNFTLSFWNDTDIEKESCIGGLVEYLRPRQYVIVLDDGWQPWDFVVNHGVWGRAEVNLLVENHGGSSRQLDVAARLRRTRLARLVSGGLLVGAAFSALGGVPGFTGVFAAALAISEGLVALQCHRLGQMLYRAIENTAASLPLEPVKPQTP